MGEGGPLFAAIERQAQARPKAVALDHPRPTPESQPWTWELLCSHAEYIAGVALSENGDIPEPRIGWLQHNHPHAITSLLACALAGWLHVPLNWRLSEAELRAIEEDCALTGVLGHSGDDGPGEAFLPFGVAHPYLDGLNLGDRPWHIDADSYAGALCGPSVWENLRIARQRVSGETPLLLAYTSGSTGRAKGVVLTQSAVMANIAHAQAVFGFTEADRVLTVLPLFHLGGLCIQTLPALVAGAQVILHPRFDPDAFFDALEREHPTLTLLVPAVMHMLVNHPRWARADLSSLRAVGAGSSGVPLALIEAFHAKGVPVQQVYGMTEAGPIAIAQSREAALAAPGSIGFPIGGCEARLGEADEIQLRGPNLFTGYWNDAEATAAAFTPDGWFRTGDVGRQDAEGRFWFTDRLKRVIISGGENIYPAELERVLAGVPGVQESAVIGRPDARWGEVPVAVIVEGEGFHEATLHAAFEAQLARFKHPRAVLRVAALPRTALGKVEVGKLAAMLADQKA
jgi:fatty-acyl-CoA synthase